MSKLMIDTWASVGYGHEARNDPRYQACSRVAERVCCYFDCMEAHAEVTHAGYLSIYVRSGHQRLLDRIVTEELVDFIDGQGGAIHVKRCGTDDWWQYTIYPERLIAKLKSVSELRLMHPLFKAQLEKMPRPEFTPNTQAKEVLLERLSDPEAKTKIAAAMSGYIQDRLCEGKYSMGYKKMVDTEYTKRMKELSAEMISRGARVDTSTHDEVAIEVAQEDVKETVEFVKRALEMNLGGYIGIPNKFTKLDQIIPPEYAERVFLPRENRMELFLGAYDPSISHDDCFQEWFILIFDPWTPELADALWNYKARFEAVRKMEPGLSEFETVAPEGLRITAYPNTQDDTFFGEQLGSVEWPRPVRGDELPITFFYLWERTEGLIPERGALNKMESSWLQRGKRPPMECEFPAVCASKNGIELLVDVHGPDGIKNVTTWQMSWSELRSLVDATHTIDKIRREHE